MAAIKRWELMQRAGNNLNEQLIAGPETGLGRVLCKHKPDNLLSVYLPNGEPQCGQTIDSISATIGRNILPVRALQNWRYLRQLRFMDVLLALASLTVWALNV